MGFMPLVYAEVCEREIDLEQRPLARLRVYCKASTEVVNAFLHSEQAQSAHTPGVEASPIVLNAEADREGAALQNYVDGAGLCVVGYVV